MSSTFLIENLISFNLTRQEATIYVALLTHGEMTGYEVAKETGIARSNVYSALQSLVEKGALYLLEGETTKYVPVAADTFLKNVISELKQKSEVILQNLPKKIETTEGTYQYLADPSDLFENIHIFVPKFCNETDLQT